MCSFRRFFMKPLKACLISGKALISFFGVLTVKSASVGYLGGSQSIVLSFVGQDMLMDNQRQGQGCFLDEC